MYKNILCITAVLTLSFQLIFSAVSTTDAAAVPSVASDLLDKPSIDKPLEEH